MISRHLCHRKEETMKNLIKHGVVLLAMGLVVLATIVTMPVLSASAADVPLIKLEELKNLIESNDPNILVVDTQPKGVYDAGHIKGAVSFPWNMEIRSPGNLPRNKTLIFYCDCAHEEDSLDVAEQLMRKFRYTNVKVLEGGWSKWQQLGYPVDKK
jgi:3-mercaptopyruvate sulfurtransferase SseA